MIAPVSEIRTYFAFPIDLWNRRFRIGNSSRAARLHKKKRSGTMTQDLALSANTAPRRTWRRISSRSGRFFYSYLPPPSIRVPVRYATRSGGSFCSNQLAVALICFLSVSGQKVTRSAAVSIQVDSLQLVTVRTKYFDN